MVAGKIRAIQANYRETNHTINGNDSIPTATVLRPVGFKHVELLFKNS